MTPIKTILMSAAAAVGSLSLASVAQAGTTIMITPDLGGTVSGSVDITAVGQTETFKFTIPKDYVYTFNYTSGSFLGNSTFPGLSNGSQITVGPIGPSTGTGVLSYSLTTAVPEPATWALMLLGVGGVGFALRRRARTAKSSVATA